MSMTSYIPTKRLAVILPSTNTTLEPLSTQILLPLLATSTISLHYTRLRLPKTHAPTLSSILEAGSAVTDLNPDFILYTNSLSLSTTSSANDEALVQSLQATTSVPNTTLPLAFLSALQYLNLTRVALVTPFSAGTTGRISDFFQGNNITVVKIIRLNPAPETEQEIADTDREDIEDLVFAAADHEAVEAVLVVSEALFTAGTVELLERETGKVVLEGVGVGLWAGLRGCGWKGGVRGWGRLLAGVEMEEKDVGVKDKRRSKDVAKIKNAAKLTSGRTSPQVRDGRAGFAHREANARREAGVLTAMRETNAIKEEPSSKEGTPVRENFPGRAGTPVKGNAFSEANARREAGTMRDANGARAGTPTGIEAAVRPDGAMRQEPAIRPESTMRQETTSRAGLANGDGKPALPEASMAIRQAAAARQEPVNGQNGVMTPQSPTALPGAIQPELFMRRDGAISPVPPHDTPSRPEPPLEVSPFARAGPEASIQPDAAPQASHSQQNVAVTPQPVTSSRPTTRPDATYQVSPYSQGSPYSAQNGGQPASPLYSNQPPSPFQSESPMLSHPANRRDASMRAFRQEFASRTPPGSRPVAAEPLPRDWSGVRPGSASPSPAPSDGTPTRPVGSTRPLSHQRIPVIPSRSNGGVGNEGDARARVLRGSGRGMDGKTAGAQPAKRMSIGVAE